MNGKMLNRPGPLCLRPAHQVEPGHAFAVPLRSSDRTYGIRSFAYTTTPVHSSVILFHVVPSSDIVPNAAMLSEHIRTQQRRICRSSTGVILLVRSLKLTTSRYRTLNAFQIRARRRDPETESVVT